MIICDTNIFIHAFNEDQESIDELDKIGHNKIVLPSITVMELFQGMGNKNELAWMKSKIKYYDVIEFNEGVSKLSQKLIEKYNLSHGLKIPDAIIAATAITFDLELFTYNLKDFNFIPNIRLYKKKGESK